MKYPVHNHTKMAIYVGALMIPPGETRHFDLDQLPPEHRPVAETPEPEAPKDPLVELAEGTVKEILLAIVDLSDEDLARLKEIESSGKDRKGVLQGIAEEGLLRAQKAEEAKKAAEALNTPPAGDGEQTPPVVEGEQTPPAGDGAQNPKGAPE